MSDFDFIVIGSGFGGSVSALRLSEKGYRVAVLEQGRRWTADNLPKSNWDAKNYIWRRALGLRGFFSMKIFRHIAVLHGCAVGGGSITYAQTLWQPKGIVWGEGEWAQLANWRELMPKHYETAKKMLGATKNQRADWADEQLKTMAQAAGIGDTFYHTDVGVFFGDDTKPQGASYPDPYFDGKGPERNSCIGCGGCMVGCRYNAKNTLDKNYLYLAEGLGAQVFSETEVLTVMPINHTDGRDGYSVETRSSRWGARKKTVVTASNIVFSGGSIGTQLLLFKMKDKGYLPNVSNCLGHKVRSNSESLISIRYLDATEEQDNSKGIAIGSGVFVDEHTHIEATRYPRGSSALFMFSTVMALGDSHGARVTNWLKALISHPIKVLKMSWPRRGAEQTLILLCMQTIDGSLTMKYQSKWYWPFVKKLQTTGAKIPTNIPNANAFALKGAEVTGGAVGVTMAELFLDIPLTAHCLGGATMGADINSGVCDVNMKVFGYENMWICDGSVVSANLGVNPSLTITALAEHAMSQIPSKSVK